MITTDMLRKLDACWQQTQMFNRLFGGDDWADTSAEVTEENVVRAINADLDIQWLGNKMFQGKARERYHTEKWFIWQTTNRAENQNWKQYYIDQVISWEEFSAAQDKIREDNNGAFAKLFVECYQLLQQRKQGRADERRGEEADAGEVPEVA